MAKVKFANPFFSELAIDDSYPLDEYYPRCYDAASGERDKEAIRYALQEPIGCPRICTSVKNTDKVLILIDDKSRSTPVKEILPLLIAELSAAGVPDDCVKIMVALGTHRYMTQEELKERVGKDIYARFTILNHLWEQPEHLQHLGVTEQKTQIWLNKLAVQADYIIGVGHIVPHRVAGYSGGAKIVQPGISGPLTTGQTHWLSALYSAEQMLGKADNPVRREIEAVAEKIAFKFIVNVVQDSRGKVAGVFAGHPVAAHRAGCSFAQNIYGVQVEQKADIVIAESYPAESELWIATKALQAAAIVVKSGGVIILAAECQEGISCSHGRIIEEYGFRPFAEVKQLLEQGLLEDLNVASYLARVGNILEETKTILVNKGITAKQGEKIGFAVCDDLPSALKQALTYTGEAPRIAVLHQGSELLPILSKKVEVGK